MAGNLRWIDGRALRIKLRVETHPGAVELRRIDGQDVVIERCHGFMVYLCFHLFDSTASSAAAQVAP